MRAFQFVWTWRKKLDTLGLCMVDINLVISYNQLRRYPLKFKHLQAYTDAFKHLFYPSAIKIWNSLPNEVALSSSLEQFKEKLNL